MSLISPARALTFSSLTFVTVPHIGYSSGWGGGGHVGLMTGRVFGEVVSWTRSGVHAGVIDSGGLGRLVAAG